MKYNWQHKNWPDFVFDAAAVQDELWVFSEKTGRIDGLLTALPEAMRMDAIVELMVSEAVNSSAIEGEMISRPDVMSSIKNNLGLDGSHGISDMRAKGIADLMVCVRQECADPLSDAVLFHWHEMLMAGTYGVIAGAWRSHEEPMLIVSGPMGEEVVHYEAPPSSVVPFEIKSFIHWFNATGKAGPDELRPGAVRAAIAHLYFESIHPFEDGNGRIGRALAEKALSQGLGRPALLSLSRAIDSDRAGYYAALKDAQQSLDITSWIVWFVKTLLIAQEMAETEIEFTLKKAIFFGRFNAVLNDRQLKVVRRMFRAGPSGFAGGMTAKKYMSITKVSKPTATRDLQRLVAAGALLSKGDGRSSHYDLNINVTR